MTKSDLDRQSLMDCSSRSCFHGNCFAPHYQQPTEWGALPKDQLQRLDEVGECRNYKAGEVLFHQGDAFRGVYYVRNGLVCIRRSDTHGNSIIFGRLAFPGNSFGFRPWLAGEPHRSSAEVLVPSTVCFIRAPVVQGLFKIESDFEHRVLQQMAKALGDAEEAYFQNLTQSAQSRLANLLLLLKDHYGKRLADGSIEMDLPFTWRNMSALIGVRPESMSRVIRKLDNDGIADFSGRSVCLHHIEYLLE